MRAFRFNRADAVGFIKVDAAAGGAQPDPLRAMTSPSPRRISSAKQSPPMPVCVGSITPRSAMAATAASMALPPLRSTSSAASVAEGCDVAAIPRVPKASDRPGSSKSRMDCQSTARLALRRSVISIEDGACVMQNGGLAFLTASCGVNPQAQNTGISPSPTSPSPTFW